MQVFVCWINLFEIIFLQLLIMLQVDYCVCIFILCQELLFVGYFSVGSVYVVIEVGLVESGKCVLVQECVVGLLLVWLEGDGVVWVIYVQVLLVQIIFIDVVLCKKFVVVLFVILDEVDMVWVDNGLYWLVCDL